MERDFMEKDGMDPGDIKGGRVDSALGSDLSIQWPLCFKTSSLQQFMPLETQMQEKPQNGSPNAVSLTALQTIYTSNSNINTRNAQAPQIGFSLDWNNVHQASIPAPATHASSLITMNCPLFKVHGMSNGPSVTAAATKPQPFLSMVANKNSLLGAGVGSSTPRKVVKPSPTTGQLTIFYADSVNVYDDVAWDKAQAIMLMAGEGSKATANAMHSIAEAPALPLTKASSFDCFTVAQALNLVNNHAMSSCPFLPNTLSVASEDDSSKTISTSIVTATAATILPREVPQARKASLARFLEKRKERVSNTSPYSSFDKSSIAHDTTAGSSNCSVRCGDYRTANQRSKYQANDCEDNTRSLSTNLEM